MLRKRFFLAALLLGLCFTPFARSEVIYDNTQFFLQGYASEMREYGDQVDLEGTARTLTDLTFYYFGDFEADGNEVMKVRLYSNEVPYDLYRNAPTKLLYESGNMPFNPGYNSRTLSNLNVHLPFDTVTFTIQFSGLKPNEIAGLLLYSPPTVGASFNEFWGRNEQNGWDPFYYSSTDPARKANAGLKLVARSESEIAATQTNREESLALRGPTTAIRAAQTFTPAFGGRLDRVELSLDGTGGTVQLSILDTALGVPGSNVLASVLVTNFVSGRTSASLYDRQVFLVAGQVYAIECRTTSGQTATPQYLLQCSTTNEYPQGQLWSQEEPDGQWTPVSLPNGATNVDAVFSVTIVPAAPPVRITSPVAGEIIRSGQTVRIAADLNLPKISTLWRLRFFDGDRELEQLVNPPYSKPPYEVFWQPTNAGPHNIRVIAEDGFRRPFRAEPRIVTVLPPQPPKIDRIASIQRKADGGVSLVFDTLSNERIRVEYSEDLLQWKAAAVEAVGTGLEVAYDDDGPPKTPRTPKETPQRFYRVVFGE